MLTYIQFALIFLGVGLLALENYVPHGVWEHITGGLGEALVISGILGITVEQFTRSKFTKELAADVFNASVGHTLPEEFQHEMRYIFGQKVICDQHTQIVRIQRVGKLARVTCQMQRRLKNFSPETRSFALGCSIDEWFSGQPSCIKRFGYQVEGRARRDVPIGEEVTRGLQTGRPAIGLSVPPIDLPRGKAVVVWVETEEYKPLSSDQNNHFTYSTRNPRVTVICDEGIEAAVVFPRQDGNNKMEEAPGVFQFTGLVTTHQEIRVVWWETEKYEAWIAGKVQ